MTTDQLKNLRDAIDAHLRGEKVEVRPLHRPANPWQVIDQPLFNGSDNEYRPAPKESLKRWVIDGETEIWMEQKPAEYAAKLASKDLIELTETSRQSFNQPMRFWGRVIEQHRLPTPIDTEREAISNWVAEKGGRVAEFVEVVK